VSYLPGARAETSPKTHCTGMSVTKRLRARFRFHDAAQAF
jgi:hypothetical protein